jgi:hypothetical protein
MAAQTQGTRAARAGVRAAAAMRDIAGRARRRWPGGPSPRPPSASQHKVDELEARLAHIEAELEGLQDAVHRQAVREDANIEELRRRIEPEQIARDLSKDARRRGL